MTSNTKFIAMYGGVAASSLLSVPPAIAQETPEATTAPFDQWATWRSPFQSVISPSNLISEVVTIFASESRPVSNLGRRLLEIRGRALSKGLQLLDAAQISKEVASRRGET
jgi:hypothetical protein